MAAPIYALVGADPFLQTESLGDILSSLKDAQRADFDGDKAQLAEVLDELRSYSMFGGTKLVVVREADEFVSKFREKLEDFVTALGAGKETVAGTIVLRLSSLPANQRIHKAIAKVGEVRKCDPPKDSELPGWITRRAKAVHKVEVASEAARHLAELIGADLGRLDSEIAKLAIQSETGKITTADITLSVSFQREQEIKEVIGLLGRGHAEEAVRKWRHLIQSDPSSEYRAVTWLGMWLEKCRSAVQMKEKGVPLGGMSRTLWINDPTELKEFVGVASRLGNAGITRQLRRLTDIDRRIKSGLGDAADNVERFIATAIADGGA